MNTMDNNGRIKRTCNCVLWFVNLLKTYIDINISSMLNYLYIKKVSNKLSYVVYYYNGKKYLFPLTTSFQKTPELVDIIDVETNSSIFNKIKPIMGPNFNFYNLNITPKMLGYKKLLFKLDDKELIFDMMEQISI